MKQVRKNIFESNSSSVHALCISKEDYTKYKDKIIHFEIGEYGWGDGTADPEDYLYSAIFSLYYEYNNKKFNALIDKLQAVLDKHDIEYTFQIPKNTYGYIDHDYELREFIDTLLDDEDKLLRFLLNPESVVYTGNDNSSEEDAKCWYANEFIYDDDYNEIANPNHDETKFEYYMKGN